MDNELSLGLIPRGPMGIRNGLNPWLNPRAPTGDWQQIEVGARGNCIGLSLGLNPRAPTGNPQRPESVVKPPRPNGDPL